MAPTLKSWGCREHPCFFMYLHKFSEVSKMTETQRQIAHARLKEEDRIYERRQHMTIFWSVAFTLFTVFALTLAWYNNII